MIARRLTHLLAVSAVALGLLGSAVAAHAEFGVEPGSFTAGSLQPDGSGLFDLGATADIRAGGHPFQANTDFALNTLVPAGGGSLPDGLLRDVFVKLPPGFIGNPHAVPQCSEERLDRAAFCPNDTAVGVVHLRLTLKPLISSPGHNEPGRFYYLPVYNMVPNRGEPALLGFHIPEPSQSVFIHLRLDSSRNYAITAGVFDISSFGSVYSSELLVWGTPADASHDAWRGWFGFNGTRVGAGGFSTDGCLEGSTLYDGEEAKHQGSCPSDAQPAKPFLTDPVACGGRPLVTGIAVDSWEAPGGLNQEGEPELGDPSWKTAEAESPPVEGCEDLQFGGPRAPVSLTFQPTGHAADTPSGYEVQLSLPYNEEPESLANPTLENAKVSLPEGVVVNPSSANGLGACTASQIGLTTPVGSSPIRFTGQPANCPPESKIGTVEVTTPLIDHTLQGSVFLAKQFDNPFGSLLAIYLTVEDPETGTYVKLAGHVETSPTTGRITTMFSENPQLPFTQLKLHLFGGQGASLLNPQTCGVKTTTSVLTPSSAPATPAVTYQDSFPIESGVGGGSCPAGEPNAPSFKAGSVYTNAGTYSPFVMKLTRADGSQRFKSIDLSLPEGLTGKLAGITKCSEAQIAQATSRSHPGEGAVEQAHPSCPAASQVGVAHVAAGAGSQPYHVSGNVYLAGPYKGAPFSLVIVTPAVAGPFDLGTVVVRAGLYIDPHTAQVTVKSDPIPSILEGIPLDVRTIEVEMSKPDFTLNPTSCETMKITGSETSALGNVAPLSDRFQVGGCQGLVFKPSFKVATKAHHTRRGGAYLHVAVGSEQGQANIAKVHVALPIKLPARNSTLKLACTEDQFAANPAGCPEGSLVGTAEAHTPLLASPLKGPAIYVSHGGRSFPDLDIVLQGEGITIDLTGNTFISKKGVTTSTFASVPDVPVNAFSLTLPEGQHSALAGFGNFCKRTVVQKKRVPLRHKGKVVHRHGHVVYRKLHRKGHVVRRHGKVVFKKRRVRRKVKRKLLMPTTITGQNGAVVEQATRIKVQGCTAGKGKGKHNGKRGRGKHRGKGKAVKATAAHRHHRH